ncbi:MAG TPA: iron-containing alcohol dehydrogenase [Candidatus Anaerobiospirillum stercoravium]|nr:iron-containing alcohol dehydrogenase [Candidatus Anaerobiospirillum stercoravium]
MQAFEYYSPTKLVFGLDCIKDKLSAEIKSRGYKKVLMTYGGGSIKRSGLYDLVQAELKQAGCTVFELSGIEPNPRVTSVDAGAAICKKEGIDLVLAVGGGSTMDASKAICAAACYDGASWDLVLDSSKITAALPLFTINTIAATGSEYDSAGVITNLETKEKLPIGSVLLWPQVSFLDPSLTYTVPANQTIAGTCDMMSHFFEAYFVRNLSPIAQGVIEAAERIAIANTPIALKDPTNYEARSKLLWASTLGCNGFATLGSSATIFPCHAIEHEVSAYYDITHGIGLAILTPRLLRFWLEKDPSVAPRYIDLACNIFGLKRENYGSEAELIEAGLKSLEDFYASLGVPSGLGKLGITNEHFKAMAEHIKTHWIASFDDCFVPMTTDDIVTVLERSL